MSTSNPYTDDKSPHCIPFILRRLTHHQSSTPFIVGLNGVQGAGKTTLVSALQSALQSQNLETLVLSIDDLYLTHAEQVRLAETHGENALVQQRGELGTHDMRLARRVFEKVLRGEEVRVPAYDKSLFDGAGDRVSSEEWRTVNAPSTPKIQVLIFEGWCVGFRSLSPETVKSKYESASSKPTSTLRKHKIEHLELVNYAAKEYDVMTDTFDAFIHIDAAETGWVYEWRLEQEAQLRREKGTGMSDEQVVRFVDGYYPAYELYTEGVRTGVLKGEKRRAGALLRLVVGRDRKVVDAVEI